MRLDEGRIPRGGGVKVRCPRCQGIGFVKSPVTSAWSEDRGAPGAAPETDWRFPAAGSANRGPSAMRSPAVRPDEPSIPDDAFENFRFPAEADDREPERKQVGRGTKVLLWAAVSLAVVALFALLVNLVLPGPAGRKPFMGAMQEEQKLPKAPAQRPETAVDPKPFQVPASR
ncbi:MAG: hypothetical protein FJY85_00480 [Deltaproteobacteria bacterium]|nr:hypothetical protein [Deltaproteobacteria bacterium]